MKKVLITAMVMSLTFSLNVMGQDTIPLTFEEAVEIALKQNVNYQSLKNQQEVLRLEKTNAKLRHLPNLNINNSFYKQIGQQFQQVEGQLIVTNQINNIISSGLQSRMPIFNGGARLHQTQAAVYYEEAGQNALARTAEVVIFDIAQQYLQVLLDEELYKIALENLENQKKQLEQIEGFVKAGLRTLSDQYNQQSEVARLETVALDAKIQWETDLWTLAETLQLESAMVPDLTPVLLGKQESEFLELPLEELYAIGMSHRKDYKQQELLEAANKKMVNVQRSMMFPQVNAFFNYNTFFTSLDERVISEQLFLVYPQRTIGISLNIPIFNNFDNKVNVARSRLEYQNQLLEKKALERKIPQDIKLAYENYKASIKRQEATQVQLAAAEEAQKAISERFRLGVSNFVDLAQANQQLVTAQSDHAQALYTLYFQEIILKFALGMLEIQGASY
ncbi:TolC family protein [Negadavirga shengliensis]|uniref:TolC family protein n=1 Tax=Negadavirga shengliensis TaxID=1389218 RepID=A0ABV9T6N6_9BACT